MKRYDGLIFAAAAVMSLAGASRPARADDTSGKIAVPLPDQSGNGQAGSNAAPGAANNGGFRPDDETIADYRQGLADAAATKKEMLADPRCADQYMRTDPDEWCERGLKAADATIRALNKKIRERQAKDGASAPPKKYVCTDQDFPDSEDDAFCRQCPDGCTLTAKGPRPTKKFNADALRTNRQMIKDRESGRTAGGKNPPLPKSKKYKDLPSCLKGRAVEKGCDGACSDAKCTACQNLVTAYCQGIFTMGQNGSPVGN